MAGEGKTYRWNMRVEPTWMERVRSQAERLGINPTDYVTMAVNERLERDEAARPGQDRGKAKRKAGAGRKAVPGTAGPLCLPGAGQEKTSERLFHRSGRKEPREDRVRR